MDPNALIPLLQAGVAGRVYSLSQPIGGYGVTRVADTQDMSTDGVGFDQGGNPVSLTDPTVMYDSGGNPMSTQPSLANVGGGITPAPTDPNQPSFWQKALSGIGDFAKGIAPGLQAIGGVASAQQEQAFQAQQQYLREKAAMLDAMISRQAPGFHSEGGTTQPLRFAAGAPGVTIDPLASYAELLRGLR